MTLTNPTDDRLNEAFAVHVAGWTPDRYLPMSTAMYPPIKPGDTPEPFPTSTFIVPNFTASADAVLPYLDACRWEAWNHENREYTVKIGQKGFAYYTGRHRLFTVACVIALIRAHGVEVEFTK